jgi:hypothetical protein
MANRAYLLNIPIVTSDPYALQAGLSQCNEYVEIADASYRIPLPWLCCFNGAPLYSVSVPTEPQSEDCPNPLVIELPCIDVVTAQQNLHASLSVFQEFAGDAATGEGYWKHACEGLMDLPLSYLTLNPIDVLFMEDPSDVAMKLAACFRSSQPDISLLKSLAKPWDGFTAYSASDFYSLPFEKLDHKARLESSRALDAAYLGKDSRYWHRSTTSQVAAPDVAKKPEGEFPTTIAPLEETGQKLRPWWKIW